ncbi:MAG: peptide deformylase [Actinomycetota bacterium]
MPVRPVVRLPDRVLKRRAEEVGEAPAEDLVADLIDTMRASPACVGLAAPQIGVARRAIVVDVSDHPKTTTSHGLIVMLDPVIELGRVRTRGREGCMSVPDLTADVIRATAVIARGRSVDGAELAIETDGFEARALQHEVDHLDGLLILDRVSSLARDVFPRRVYR